MQVVGRPATAIEVITTLLCTRDTASTVHTTIFLALLMCSAHRSMHLADAPRSAAANKASLLHDHFDSAPATFAQAFVRDVPGDKNVTVSLLLDGRQRNLDRPKDEALERPLARLRANIAPDKKPTRKKTKKGDAPGANGEAAAAAAPPAAEAVEEGDPVVALYADDEASQPLDGSLPNGAAWKTGRVLQVRRER